MKRKMTNRDKTFWAVLIPVLILFFTFNTLPMIKGVIYSFTNYRGYGSYDYVGFRNYIDLFTDVRVGKHIDQCAQPDHGTGTEQQNSF